MGKYDAQSSWNAKNTTLITVRLSHNTDADILEFLATQQNKQGLIKQLLRDHIAAVTSSREK